MSELRAALAQEHEDWCASVTQLLLCDPPKKAPCNCRQRTAEPLNLSDPDVQRRLAAQWGYVPAEQAEPDISRCPKCNGPADNGFTRSFPPSPYLCTKCMAEPVQEILKE